MASIMLCEGGHEENVVGEILTQYLSAGESTVHCAGCYEQFLWAAVEALPTFDARVKGYMDKIMEQQQNKASAAARKRRKAGLPETEAKDSDGEIADVESTPDGQ